MTRVGARAHRARLALLVVTAGLACDPAPPSVPAPTKRFVAEGVTVTEVRGAAVAWRGRVETADGDLGAADVSGITLEHLPPVDSPLAPYAKGLTVHAPRGRLDFDAGVADLEDVRITTEDGGELTARAAHFSEEDQRIDVHGPLRLNAPGLRAEAQRATVDLRAGTIDIEGPVRGRWE